MTAKQSGDPQNSEAGSATKRGAKKKSPRRKKTGRTIGPTPTRIKSPYAAKTTKRPAKKSRRQSKSIRLP